MANRAVDLMVTRLKPLVDRLLSISEASFEYHPRRYLETTLPPHFPSGWWPLNDCVCLDHGFTVAGGREISGAALLRMGHHAELRVAAKLFLILLDGRHRLPIREVDLDQVLPSLKMLRENDRLLRSMCIIALRDVANESRKVQHSEEARVLRQLDRILRVGTMPLQAEVAYVLFDFFLLEPEIHDQLVLHDLVGSLVSIIQLTDYTNKAIPVGVARHHRKRKEVANDGNEKSTSGEQVEFPREDSPEEVEATLITMAAHALGVLAKGNASLCGIIIEGLDDMAFSLGCLGIEVAISPEGQVQVSALLKLLTKGSLYDKLISVVAVGRIAQQSGKVEHLVEAGVLVVFGKIIREGPMLLQAEVAHALSKFVAVEPTIRDNLPLHDLVGSLVSIIQVTDDIKKAIPVGVARHHRNGREVANYGNEKSTSGKQIGFSCEDSPEVKTRLRAMAAKDLGVLAKGNASLCGIIIEGLDNVAFSLGCLGVKVAISPEGQVQVSELLKLLRKGSLYDKLIIVMALGRIAQQSGKVEHLVEAGVLVVFGKIIREGPMLLQAEVAHALSKFVAVEPTIRDNLPLHDLVGSLVSIIQVTDDIKKAIPVGVARHHRNGREVANYGNEKSMSGKQIGFSCEDSPEVKTRLRAMAAKDLGVLAKGNASLSGIIIEGLDNVAFSLGCLGVKVAISPEGQVQVSELLKLLRKGSLYDKLIIVMALGRIAQQSGKVEHLIETGVLRELGRIIREGTMPLQAEVADAVSKFVAIEPTIRDKLPASDLVGSLVSLLQVEAVEEHFEDDVNRATSVLSVVAARHSSNRRKAANDRNEDSRSGEQIQSPCEDSPKVKDRMRMIASKVLGVLAKDNASMCRMIIEKGAVQRFARLLQDSILDVKCFSAMALMEITAVAEKDADLRRSFFKHNSRVHKVAVDQLMRIIVKALDQPQSSQQISPTQAPLVPCIKAIGNLATTFRESGPIIPLVCLLKSNCEVLKETLIALIKFACKDNFLHLDHSKAIISHGGLIYIDHLATNENMGVQKHALVLLCCITLDALGGESDNRKAVLSAINFASRRVRFSKGETDQAQLVQEAKRRLG